MLYLLFEIFKIQVLKDGRDSNTKSKYPHQKFLQVCQSRNNVCTGRWSITNYCEDVQSVHVTRQQFLRISYLRETLTFNFIHLLRYTLFSRITYFIFSISYI